MEQATAGLFLQVLLISPLQQQLTATESWDGSSWTEVGRFKHRLEDWWKFNWNNTACHMFQGGQILLL